MGKLYDQSVRTNNTALPTLSITSDEAAIAVAAVAWLRGDVGGRLPNWQDRIGYQVFAPISSPARGPLSVNTGGQNGRSYVLMQGGANPGALIAPVGTRFIKSDGDWSIAGAFQTPSGTRAILGNALSAGYFLFRINTIGDINILLDGIAYISAVSAVVVGAFFSYVLSYKHSSRDVRLRINGVQVGSSTSTLHSINASAERPVIGAAWTGDALDPIVNSSWDSKFYDMIFFAEAIHNNASLLASVEAYLRARYAHY